MNRFGEHGEGPGAQREDSDVAGHIRGAEDGGNAEHFGPDRLQDLEAVGPRHPVVEQGQIEPARADEIEGLGARLRQDDLRAQEAEELGEPETDLAIVVGDEDAAV